METHFGGKPKLREAIEEAFGNVAPSFDGAMDAARRLLDAPVFEGVTRIAMTDHASQQFVREFAIARGIEVLPIDAPNIGQVNLIVTGASAVTRGGKRCGVGRGSTDLGFAILRQRGHATVPLVTTVADEQIVRFFPTYDHDVDLSWIATPSELIEVPGPVYAPAKIRWDRLLDEHLAARPDLNELRE